MTAFLRQPTHDSAAPSDRFLHRSSAAHFLVRNRWQSAGLLAFLAIACGGSPSIDSEGGSSGGKSAGSRLPHGSSTSPSIIDASGGGKGGTSSGSEEPSICGNGTLESKELCDDGNTSNGDGCSSDCTTQDPSFSCSRPGEACVKWMECGNGVIEGTELCDDGNAAGGDGCSASCDSVEGGWGCARPGKPCFELPACGNGIRERGEGCDDGQSPPEGSDGCNKDCQVEDGYICLTPGQACVKKECGDGNRTPEEQCDDHNSTDNDGCSSKCEIESGYRCSAQGCSSICGDGVIIGAETCDDGNLTTGDGCSAACRVEPFVNCTGTPSQCTSTIRCGNGIREPGEVCDPPGTNGCNADCKGFAPDVIVASECGNQIIEFGETCDPPSVGSGCSAMCQAEPNWTCLRPGNCTPTPRCGDGLVNLAEGCDDGNSAPGDGCNNCQPEADYTCTGLGPSHCVKEVCGDGIRTASEQCDDGTNGAGCTNCRLDSGWVCPVPGAACQPRCGDGVRTGGEACDDGNRANKDGCNAACKVELGFTCPTQGRPCVPSTCGNNKKESGEYCDDGNTVAGDGCGPTCQGEPTITPAATPAGYPTVVMACGDGLITSGEACDDGNVASGDGCSSTCAKEDGFTCDPVMNLPTSVQFRVTYRDFKSGNANSAGGHPDFQYEHLDVVSGITGPVCTSTNTATCGRLDAEGKPSLVNNNQRITGIRDAGTFSLWYRNTNPNHVLGGNLFPNADIEIAPFVKPLRLTQVGSSDTYTFDANGAFYPLAGNEGFGNIGQEVAHCTNDQGAVGVTNTTGHPACDICDATCMSRNYGFTTELRYFFQYGGGETLTFRGDDDVWVYINGRLAVDIGGLHPERFGRVVLGDDGTGGGGDSNCSLNATVTENPLNNCYTPTEQADSVDTRFNLTKGRVYEIVLFHAERHTTASNFRLTLAGFLAPRSDCNPICGDGTVVAGEVCDDGPNNKDNVAGACNTTCTMRAFCGDGIRQIGEACDNGVNTDLYVAAPSASACAPGCELPPTCGDGRVQGTEQCDRGALNDDNSYGRDSCTKACKFGGYCGDGLKNGNEACDRGAQNGISYGPDSCDYNCQPGPRCGDGQRNGSEECDEGPTGGLSCDSSCHIAPHCGDGVVSAGEECDYGIFASNDYGGCTKSCKWGPVCGDGNVNKPNEDCDDGKDNNTGAYGACSANCLYGARCGDGKLQSEQGEQCDNGFNSDVYGYYPEACGPSCRRPPYCGDGQTAPGYELCDAGSNNRDTAYEGCTSKCDWGPYCGDGHLDAQGGEVCDNGSKNVVYGHDTSACGFDCRPAPFCGDGERNGPEQCDLGAEKNTGAYGTCNADCTLSPRCGDKIVQDREQCDDGPTGSLKCSPTCTRRGDPLL